jgi:hypothetical protein
VDHLFGQNDDLLSVAATHASDINALCADVAAIIFPTAINPPTDAVIAAVSTKLVQLVSEIESKLLTRPIEPNSAPVTWTLLYRSGFLREADLVDFVLARVSEDRLEARLDATKATLPERLLDHADGNVADSAQILLAADSLHRRSRANSYLALPPELFHKLCWRIVAALEVSQGQRSPEVIAAARNLIANYDEGQTIVSAARKVVHFIGNDHHAELLDPEQSGLHLFIAKISAEVNLDHDHILRLIDSRSLAPLAAMLSALGISKEDASNCLMLLSGQRLTVREAAIFDNSYSLIEHEAVAAEIAAWSISRSNYLALGNP